MITKNFKNHNDLWLVFKEYFKENYELVKKEQNLYTQEQVSKIVKLAQTPIKTRLGSYYSNFFEILLWYITF